MLLDLVINGTLSPFRRGERLSLPAGKGNLQVVSCAQWRSVLVTEGPSIENDSILKSWYARKAKITEPEMSLGIE